MDGEHYFFILYKFINKMYEIIWTPGLAGLEPELET